ncbi:Glucanosyltransferase-domain-containing protein [Phaeosphaeria sp. MPI-PUGE-AT-0046c]|nr:Glucanosyltransferase-domain-containing protein [Phaeosphaeria sp. MPI-PUGE-AT-0046c]
MAIHNMVKILAWLLLLATTPIVSALGIATTRGPYLVNNDTQGMITMNGIWYSLSNSTTDTNAMDSLKDAEACTRDAALMAQAGINTIYVMAIDPKANHDECFSIFNSVGIYVMVVLRQDGVFNLDHKAFTDSYTAEFLKGMFQIIDAVKDYDNLLGFNIGLLPTYTTGRSANSTVSYADIMKMYRSFIRDIKSYIAIHASRPILVGTDLNLIRVDGSERLDAADESTSHAYYFTCAIDGKPNDLSRSDYVSFYNLGYFEIDPVEKQNASYLSLQSQLKNVTAPTWFSYMAIFDEADIVEYELRPDLVMDTFFLFNSSSELIRPRGQFSGGARVAWTNAQIGKQALGQGKVRNWGLTATSPNGDVILTENYDAYRGIIDQVNPGNWLDGESPPPPQSLPNCNANAQEMTNKTVNVYVDKSTTLALATDWVLPTRPPGLDALITNGAMGKRGQMVDVTVTTIAHAIRDHKGAMVTNLVLKPSSSAKRTTTATNGFGTATSAPGDEKVLSTGAKAGIGAGAGVAALTLIGVGTLLLLRRRRNRKQADPAAVMEKNAQQHSDAGSAPEGFQKAELATGPAVEKYQAELEAREGKTPQEVDGTQNKYEMYSPVGQEPVELPAHEKPVEAPSNGTVR